MYIIEKEGRMGGGGLDRIEKCKNTKLIISKPYSYSFNAFVFIERERDREKKIDR